MAKRTIEVLTDDWDGKELKEGEGQTVTFGVGRTQYELDLSDRNAEKFFDTLKPYMDKARKVGTRSRSGGSAPTDKSQLQAIREWAHGTGLSVSARGRISKEVRDAYEAAH